MYVRVNARPAILRARWPFALAGLGGFGLGAAQAVTPAQLTIAQMVVDAANAYGVPPQLALGIAAHESGFNPSAVNPSGGAAGVMQLIPSTAAGLGVSDPLDAQQNIDGGVSMLATLLQQYNGNETLALWAYSNGAGSVTAGGSNPANMPAQAAGLVSYVQSYQPPASLDLSGSADLSTDGTVSALPSLDDLSSGVTSFLGSLDPSTLAWGGAAIALVALVFAMQGES
jgi:transglycosylase-like protein with SLT domain